MPVDALVDELGWFLLKIRGTRHNDELLETVQCLGGVLENATGDVRGGHAIEGVALPEHAVADGEALDVLELLRVAPLHGGVEIGDDVEEEDVSVRVIEHAAPLAIQAEVRRVDGHILYAGLMADSQASWGGGSGPGVV